MREICPPYVLPFIYYPMSYMLLTGKELTDEEMKFSKTKEGMSFVNHPIVQQLMDDDIASSIYQAIKRINRDNSQLADVYLFRNKEASVELVISQLPNITVIEKEPLLKERGYDTSKENSVDQF